MAPEQDDDFIYTIYDDDVSSDEEAVEVEQEETPKQTTGQKRQNEEAHGPEKSKKRRGNGDEVVSDNGEKIDLGFDFDASSRAVKALPAPGQSFDRIDEIVERMKKSKEANLPVAENGNLEEGKEEDGGDAPGDMESDAGTAGEEDGDAEEADEVEKEKEYRFFAPSFELADPGASFAAMSLSRSVLKGLSEVRFNEPTPIQRKAIPVALQGKDIVGGAVTGSGKTAAFLVPIIERLLHRPTREAVTRVAILLPTRELALQCLEVGKKLATYTDITFGRAIGGLNQRVQEKELKQRPDIVVATTGRFIDFMHNGNVLHVDRLEILVLDEADRMLDQGFEDQLNEILKTIPRSRQTMLFSATMTSKVDDLVRAGLHQPVRIMVDAQKASAPGLVQEFVRLRPGKEAFRLGYLMHLCSSVHQQRAIVFFRQKKEAHRVRVLFALCGISAAELHGGVSQEQRNRAVEAFRSGQVRILLATDLASRGLDVRGIEAVINYEAPQSLEIYLHRVGRTARAGNRGVACTLAAESDRKIVRQAIKSARANSAKVASRSVDPRVAEEWQERCDKLAETVDAVLREEKAEAMLQDTEREVTRAENLVVYKKEIESRPKKTWFMSEKEKLAAKKKGALALNGPQDTNEDADKSGKKKKVKVKLSGKKKRKLMSKDEFKDGTASKKKQRKR
ncbi:DEAD-domain-containing protein [Piedraia hortae CBS 480.64]|uniref:RNA helicase n=1 Tax=Piedraia hortae CBS 480.64 TaxID=1314780 RepID=A0A6A7BYJ3_9PEZI|nr:DEAD-domain-containing protein [Piedraia hortae CBS 480.64]